jgi:tetratricopeptide (TPR) repeat protein
MTWFKSLTTFKKILLIIGVVIGLNFLWSFVSDLMFDAHVDGISQEFVPMSEALDAGMASKNDYDLEETIRIIHAIEHARDSSNNFQELMAFMAMQDYSLVAKDVVNCQKLLLPILQDLYFAQDDLEEHESGVQLLKDLGGVSSHAVNCTGNFMAGNMVGGTKELLNVAGGTIDVLLDRDSQSKAMQKTIRLIKDDYINYLSEYAKVYHAHMNEWNKLCLLRDRAYLDIQNGRARSAIQHLDDALEVSPNDKEARLLRALCLLQMGADAGSTDIRRFGQASNPREL